LGANDLDFGYYSDYAPGYYDGNAPYSGPEYSNPAPDSNYDSSTPSENQNDSQDSSTANSTTATANVDASAVLIYLKNGTMYAATDYWFAGNKLHYVVASGAESAVDIDQCDLQRTVDVNAKRGVPFALNPKPQSQSLQAAPASSPAGGQPSGQITSSLRFQQTA
jgi:hypothetical protein